MFNSPYIKMSNSRDKLKPNKKPRQTDLDYMTVEEKEKYLEYLLRSEPHLEKHLHLACVTYLRDNYPEVIINHTRNQPSPHGNQQSVLYGYCKGFPDLFIAHRNDKYGGLFVELKTPRTHGAVSKDQMYVHKALREQGYMVEVIWSYQDFKDLINKYLQKCDYQK